jgi:hypothetical protein
MLLSPGKKWGNNTTSGRRYGNSNVPLNHIFYVASSKQFGPLCKYFEESNYVLHICYSRVKGN